MAATNNNLPNNNLPNLNPGASGAVDFSLLNSIFPQNSLVRTGSLGSIVAAIIPYVFVSAGLLLFIYLVLGGFQLMVSRGDPNAVSAAKGKITNAFIGFIVIFISYWLVQILQKIFGLGSIFG